MLLLSLCTHRGYSLSLLTVVLLLTNTPLLQAQITAWEVSGLENYGPPSLPPTSSDANVSITALSRGPGINTTGTASSNAWGGNGFNVADQNAGITGGKFVTFTVKANSGYTINLSAISAYNIRKSSTGPTSGRWQYSTDGVNFNNIGAVITWGNNTTSAGNAQVAIDLSGIAALQGVPSTTTVTFRLVIWGASNASGTWYFNDISSGNDLELNGAVILNGAPVSSASDFFRTVKSGSWHTPNTWQSSSDNVTWINATQVPSITASGITIQNGHTVLVNSSITTDQLEIKAGGTLNYTAGLISFDNGAGDDLLIEGVFHHNGGTAIALQVGANVRIKQGGEIRVSDNVAGISETYAGNTATAFSYETGAIFHWNTSLAFASAGQVYFGNAINEVPIFRISQNMSNVGSNSLTTFNGILEINGSVTFENTGIKTFRNGIIGTGTLRQNDANTGKFIINHQNSILGINTLNLSTNGLEINHTGSTTLTRSIVLSNGRLTLTSGKIDLNGFQLDLGSTGSILEDRINQHIITDNTATDESNKGGAILCSNRIINDTPTEIAGLGITLNRTSGTDYQVNIARYHYQGGGGFGIKKIYALSASSSPIPTTNLRINYAETELNGLSEPLLISRWSEATGWQSFDPTLSDFDANYAEIQGLTTFSSWTLSETLSPLPVRLLDFRAVREESENILLHWQTSWEVENLGFEIETSKDRLNFEKIGFVEGKGSNSTSNHYEFRHQESESAYYRLKQIDHSGTFEYSNILFLKGIPSHPRLYPNPIHNPQNIILSGLENHTPYQVFVRDSQGKILQEYGGKSTEISEKLNLGLPMLSSGIYYLEIQSPSDTFTLKFLKVE